MKAMRKSNLFATSIFMLLIFITIGFLGCEQENLFPKSYSEYLDLDSYELSEMSANDLKTIGLALQRLDITFENGLYQIKQFSGAQVNISEELYEYVIKGFDFTNKVARPKSVKGSGPRLKSGYADPPDTTYCVAYAIAGMGDFDFSKVYNYIDSIWGSQGVPASEVNSAVLYFYPNSTPYTGPTEGGMMNGAFMWYPTSDSTGHAVNGVYYDANTGYIMYSDDQNNTTGIVSKDSVQLVIYPDK